VPDVVLLRYCASMPRPLPSANPLSASRVRSCRPCWRRINRNSPLVKRTRRGEID